MPPRPFRFGIHLVEPITSRAAWLARVAKAERLGYAILSLPDHFTSHLGHGPALAAAAATTRSQLLRPLAPAAIEDRVGLWHHHGIGTPPLLEPLPKAM